MKCIKYKLAVLLFLLQSFAYAESQNTVSIQFFDSANFEAETAYKNIGEDKELQNSGKLLNIDFVDGLSFFDFPNLQALWLGYAYASLRIKISYKDDTFGLSTRSVVLHFESLEQAQDFRDLVKRKGISILVDKAKEYSAENPTGLSSLGYRVDDGVYVLFQDSWVPLAVDKLGVHKEKFSPEVIELMK